MYALISRKYSCRISHAGAYWADAQLSRFSRQFFVSYIFRHLFYWVFWKKKKSTFSFFARAHMILLPKNTSARTPDDFRPISLQNCPPKAIAKAITNRLKPLIPMLVHDNQTGFISGRNIAENYIFAADLLSACHLRKAPAMILKLDFRKAFDSVCWESLLTILAARGFPSKWVAWIKTLLISSKTAILLNGVPGNWISCKNGLRQGDPLSPYLFIIVADLLQRLISKAFSTGGLCHPIYPDRPPTVLQYADDTLIVAHASPSAALMLKSILDDFALATGLSINFHKTTFVPIHTDPPLAQNIAHTFCCDISSFPQVYLGLPLSHTRLPSSAFEPLVQRFLKYLAGWAARLLSRGGRLTLISATLDALATHFMSVFKLPKKITKRLDAIRRSFFWAAEETCSGAKCLIAWKNVCKEKTYGGLGIKDLHLQNNCLLLKFAFKLLQKPDLPWAQWFLHHYSLNLAESHSYPSFLGKIIKSQLQNLFSISFVLTNNGTTTFFWFDTWLTDTPLAHKYTSLFSHSTHPYILVSEVLLNGLLATLRNRLTHVASAELAVVLSLLQDVATTDAPDDRFLTHGAPFSARCAYSLLSSADEPDFHADRIWGSKATNKVKIFGWLLFRDRLNTKANLLHKTIAPDSSCPRCAHHFEDASHLAISCPRAVQVWQLLGLTPTPDIDHLWDTATPDGLDINLWPTVALAILWKLWDSRNAQAFRSETHSATDTLRNVISDFTLWVFRFKDPVSRDAALSWRLFLS